MTQQPKWVAIEVTDDWCLLRDLTGVYDPELEIVEELSESSEDDRAWQLYTVELERYKQVKGYLVPFKYKSDWPHAVSEYQPWFADKLSSVADSCGTSEEALIAGLCSADSRARMFAYHSLVAHFGAHEFDSYPNECTRAEIDARWSQLTTTGGTGKFGRKDISSAGLYSENCRSVIHRGSLVLLRGEYNGMLGRAVGLVCRDGLGNPYPRPQLEVLVLSSEMTFAYLRHVDRDDVTTVISPGAFMHWFLHGEWSECDVQVLEALSEYGGLSEGYITKYLSGPEGHVVPNWRDRK